MEIKRGKFIVLEGLPGCGKSTQAKLLLERLPNAVLNVEPTKALFGAVIRFYIERQAIPEELLEQCLKYKNSENDFWPFIHHIVNQFKLKLHIGEIELQILYIADRMYDLEMNILPALAAGKTVIQDRYFFSTFAFGYSSGLKIDRLQKIHQEAFAANPEIGNLWKPDLTVIFDLDPVVSMARQKASGKVLDIFEVPKRLEKIREGYLQLSKRADLSTGISVINADQPAEKITLQLEELIKYQTAI